MPVGFPLARLFHLVFMLSVFEVQAERSHLAMPVLASSDHITPRSVLRHRPIGDDAEKQGKATPTGITPVAQRASRARAKKTEEDEAIAEWKRVEDEDGEDELESLAPAPQPRKTPTGSIPKTPRLKKLSSKAKATSWHPLLYLGIGMIVMLVLWTLLTLFASWWGTTWDDIHYGRPRTFQTDAVVGHNDSASNPSHFIAINLNGRIEIIEFPGGDGSKARIYLGPQLYGQGENLVPVTLSFVDVNGNGHPDMIVHFQNTQIIYINDQGGFRPASPGEIQQVQQYLQQHGG
jgi:hypothetical protein